MAAPESCGEIELPISEEDKKIHLIQRAQWLRAAILGANDGLLSTTSLMLGVGAAKEDQRFMIISGLAGALAGACSMAVGEFASVSTQREIEQKAIHEKCIQNLNYDSKNNDLRLQIAGESTLTEVNDGPSPASQFFSPVNQFFSPVRSPLMKIIFGDMRPKNEVAEEMLPNPYKAAGASACSFLCGSLVPLLTGILFSHSKIRVWGIVVVTSVALAMFGATGARLGGSSSSVSAMRVLVGGWISMAITYSLLMPFDRDDHKGHQDVNSNAVLHN